MTMLMIHQIPSGEWVSQNPVLAASALGYELDTNRHKIGDGVTPWNSLAYAGSGMLDIYPVGSLYLSISPTPPNVLFGGDWEEFGAGRMPVGINPADPSQNEPEEIGGSNPIA